MSMMGMSKCFLFAFLVGFALTVVAHAQYQSGFISIDCGMPENSNYMDETTKIYYITDAGVIDSGVSKTISPEFQSDYSLPLQLLTVRSFPEGNRNCYTLRPAQLIGNTYLIRAWFMYGNYDAQNKPPQFDLHIGADFWVTVTLENSTTYDWKEIIHVPPTDYIYVCLVNTGHGTPFISALELRPLDYYMYQIDSSESLNLFRRWDFGRSETDPLVRYEDDYYDRIWKGSNLDDSLTLNTSDYSNTEVEPPSIVLSTANTPNVSDDVLYYSWEPDNSTDQFYLKLHFAEVQVLQANESREFQIYLNGKLLYEPHIVPGYLTPNTIQGKITDSYPEFKLSLQKTSNSTLPPIINALELYTLKHFLNSLTDGKDVAAIISIKSMYGLKKNWQGDPCAPPAYMWIGLNCSRHDLNMRIISLNLSSSGLTGVIPPSINNLTMIQSLDLSNNKLTGEVPDFLSQLAFLKVLNLKGKNFTGSVPAELLAKSKIGSLSLSIDGVGDDTNPRPGEGEDTNPSESDPWKKKKVVVPVVVVSVLLIATFAILWVIKRRKQVIKKVDVETNRRDGSLEVKQKQFTYSEVLSITNNFQRVIGKGGFGAVYHGYMGHTQVAVKMLSPSSIQGYKEFQAEANLLMSVHHKNLTSLVGYCHEGTNMGIFYEYMANGNLGRHLSDRNQNVLMWEDRLRIAVDAAQGLEYLHHGCKPPIIHRDVKPTNILLNEKFQAKLSDFGLSRVFPTEGGTHVSTIVAGTPGYLDPEYYTSNRFTEKSDVYSFGVVLLEIITSRPAISKGHDKTHISQWVSSGIANGDVKNIVDPRLRGDFDVNSVWKAVELAMACVSIPSTRRPAMDYVVTELKECLTTAINCHETELKDPIGVMPMNLESAVVPLAR